MRLFLIFNIMLLFVSCNFTKEQSKEPDPFEGLKRIDESSDDYTINGSMFLFGKSDSSGRIKYGLIYRVINFYLHDPRYNQLDYTEFISNLISNSDFACDDIMQSFKINDTIRNSYDKNKFSAFLLKYSSDTINDKYIISKDLSFNSQLSVIYYLYLNNYYTDFDDYSGCYFSRKIDDFSDQLLNLKLEDWK